MKNLYAVANDLGHSSLKINITNIDTGKSTGKEVVPSVIAIQRPQNYEKPPVFDTKREQDEYFKHLENHMDVTITSPSVSTQGRFFVGQKAIDSGLPTRMFDINDFNGKSQSDLALILTLTKIATQVVKDAYKNSKDNNISNDLTANVIMTTALPIKEGKVPNVIETYQKRYTNGEHLVNLYNFEQPITVKIKFIEIYVGLEGELAQFMISEADPDLKEKIKADFDESYPELKNDVTADQLISVKNLLGIDIGDGTTDKPIIINGKANPNASTSLSTGYGSVLQDAVSILQDKGMNIQTRGDLNNFLEETISPFVRSRQEFARQTVYDQLDRLVDQIIDSASETMRHAGANIELVYVYGGGSIPLLQETNMRDRLVEKLKGFSGGFDIPVIWIDPSRARTLNEDGLQLYLDYLVDKYQNDSEE